MPKRKGRPPGEHAVVAVGSTNAAKTAGVKRAFSPLFPKLELREVDASSLVRAQPMGLEETVEGAQERAIFALESARPDFGVGVEAGLVELGKDWPGHYLNLQVAAIVDSAGHLSFGCSSGFPIPKRFAERLKQGRGELDRYTHELAGARKVREEEGIVYHLSGRRLSRVEMTEQCVSMALIPWLNGKLYGFV
ncbi:MAG TPA: inosine/xanthosine triphosphatase [Nitrososphaerales archaeon]|nr:inosine/xanthosine triphosphatase [Nitrososphaerales archaeon]